VIVLVFEGTGWVVESSLAELLIIETCIRSGASRRSGGDLDISERVSS